MEQKKYSKAIEIFNSLIKKNKRLQAPFYYRGNCYLELTEYAYASEDFNQVLRMQRKGQFRFRENKDGVFADEEARMQVDYEEVLFRLSMTNYYMDSLQAAYNGFKELEQSGYNKSNCLLWQGTVWIRSGDSTKARSCFLNAKKTAANALDSSEADRMMKENNLEYPNSK